MNDERRDKLALSWARGQDRELREAEGDRGELDAVDGDPGTVSEGRALRAYLRDLRRMGGRAR